MFTIETFDLDPSVTWATASRKYKEVWLRSRGFRQEYNQIAAYEDLPHHVQNKWYDENKA